MVTCPSCGNQVPGTSRFCPECGYNLASYAQATGQLPSLSAGTPTLDLGSLDVARQAQIMGASQDSQGIQGMQGTQDTQGVWSLPQQQPEQPFQLGTGGTGAPTSGQPSQHVGQGQTQAHGGSLVPVNQGELVVPPPPLYRDSQMLQPTELNPAGPLQVYPTFSQPPATTYGSYEVQVDDEPVKNPIMGFLLELLGLVGLLGIGQMYSGHVPRGIVMMLGWFIYCLLVLFVVFPTNLVLSFCTLGTVQCFIYPFIAIFILVPLLSGYWVHNDLEARMRRKIRRY